MYLLKKSHSTRALDIDKTIQLNVILSVRYILTKQPNKM